MTGQIGLFFINEEYKNKGLGKQILSRVILDMQNEGQKGIFVCTSKDHKFWANVFDKSFKWKLRPHSSVTGSGYYMDI